MRDVGGLIVSRETEDRLSVFSKLLEKWTCKINLISPASVPDIWQRHIQDSAQIFALSGRMSGTWVDLGSGGGLPGAVVAIMAAELAPQLSIVCVESDQRKAVFLATVSRETGVPFQVISERVEAIAPLAADVLSARALASLDVLLGFAGRHLAEDGVALFQKGARHEKERADAEKNWRFDCEAITSCTDPAAVIFKIGALNRV